MSTLIMTVGTGRRRSDIAEALLFGIDRHRPNKVVFLCTAKSEEETVPFIVKGLGELEYEVVCHSNENDVQYLYRAYLEQMKKYDEIVVDFTSGTKAMSAAVFAAAISAEARKVSYITGPRDSTGRVIESTGVVSLSPVEVIAERQLQRARELFRLCDFHAAAELADSYRQALPEGSPLQGQAKTIWMVSTAYDLWDHFKWKKARHYLRKAANPRESLVGVDTTRLAANADFLDAVVRNSWGYERLIDLANNARRRLKQGRFDDAQARLYRAFEYLVQECLRNDYDIDAGELKLERLERLSVQTRRKWRTKAKQTKGRLTVGLREGIELLAEFGSPVGEALIKMYWRKQWAPQAVLSSKDAGELQNWLNERNASFLAHGTVPAKENTVRSMLEAYDRILQVMIRPEEIRKLEEQATFVAI